MIDRAREDWLEIPVPAIVDEVTFARVQQRLEDNKRFAARNTKVPSLLQGLAACASCGYGYYRTTTTTTAGNKIYYYRCLGSDDYRYQGGRVCQNKPVRADYADKVVWDHVTALLADPALIRAEIGKRLERARTSDPVTRKRGQLEQALAKTTASIAAMITAFSEQLITIDELRARMPALRARETGDELAQADVGRGPVRVVGLARERALHRPQQVHRSEDHSGGRDDGQNGVRPERSNQNEEFAHESVGARHAACEHRRRGGRARADPALRPGPAARLATSRAGRSRPACRGA